MKKITIVLLAVLSFSQITAQQISDELMQINNKVHELDLDEKITEAFDVYLSDFEELTDEVLFDESFEIKNTNDIIDMFEAIVEAREEREVSVHIWDNFGVGEILKDRILNDGRINTDDFIGELPGGNGPNTDIGSEFRGKNDRVGPGGNKSGNDLMNPGGNIDRGGENGFKGFGGSKASGGDGTEWGVEATHFSSKSSDGSSTSTFTHHHSEVSNGNGYSSTTDKQNFTRSDGSSTTRTVVTQTQSDGSSKSSVTTSTKDSDGNTHSTTTYTAKDSDGKVTEQRTTERNEKAKDDDDSSWDPENPDSNCYRESPPTDEEKGAAVYRALSEHGFAGGRDDDRTGNSNNGDMSNTLSPQDMQNQKGYMEQKVKGGKVNVNKVMIKQQVTNPGKKN